MRRHERGRVAFWESAYQAGRARRAQGTAARYARGRAARLRASGLCQKCGQRPPSKGSHCETCRAACATRSRERYRSQVAASGRKVKRYRRRATA
ncbi:MAG: hypothetical protein M3268_00895 [Acidobacteriota bacterium]|nr:hypothetical protein [Acidobacteriota bacterium]